MSYNQIKEIPKEIKYLTQLQLIFLQHNQIKEIPTEISYLAQLKTLLLYDNKIKEIPKEIGNLTQLQILNVCTNKIKEIPKEIGNLTQLQKLDLTNNEIKEIPIEICDAVYLTQLQTLDLSFNQIKEIPKEIGHLTHLQELSFSHNQIKELPLEITNLRNLIIIIYVNNPIENLLNLIINRFITQIENRGGNIHNIYTDTQNVHSSSIQQSIKDSIYNLMKEVKDDNKINYLDDTILSIQTKEALIEYSKDNQIHTQLNCTFEEVLQVVLLEINKLPNDLQVEIKNRLNEEMEDGLCKCFTGRLSRLVNSLSGYSDKVSIKISSAEEIGNVISIMKDKYDDIEDLRMNVEKELLERGYEKEVISEWLNYL
jgi:Leucine-rich repeat (LRR) protein